MVFYSHYHPFEYYLDYEEFPEAPAPSKRDRARTLKGLKTAFGVARAFGLDTFMQHYLTHFPHGLAKAHNIIFQAEKAGSRLSALDHPVVDAYTRYVYRRTFEILPELSGFYINFESAPNSSAFLERTLLPEALTAKTPPQLVFRLWDFNSPKAMRGILKTFPGKLRLAHKVQDRADYYYWPKADPRVIEWKENFPDTEFMFLVGPCHNCGTVQARYLWSDPAFVQGLLADVQKKGADSFAFHTIYELLAQDIDAKRVIKPHEMHMALLNRGHLDAAVDYVRGETPTSATLRGRLAERTGIDTRAGGPGHEGDGRGELDNAHDVPAVLALDERGRLPLPRHPLVLPGPVPASHAAVRKRRTDQLLDDHDGVAQSQQEAPERAGRHVPGHRFRQSGEAKGASVAARGRARPQGPLRPGAGRGEEGGRLEARRAREDATCRNAADVQLGHARLLGDARGGGPVRRLLLGLARADAIDASADGRGPQGT